MSVTSKWIMTGLLAELSDSQQDECANHLENVANFLLGRVGDPEKKFFDESYAGMIIPIVRRLYDSPIRENMPDTEWLCYDFASYRNKSKLKKENCYAGIDYEAELCAGYTEDLVKRKSKIV